MKAKEYAENYKLNPTPENLSEIAFDMIIETKDIFEKRHARTDEAMFAVIKETIMKWEAFVKLVNDKSIRKEGLKDLILKEFPFLTSNLIKKKL